jgi:hypothetical protein
MQIINDIDPDFLANLDIEKNIIICTPVGEEIINEKETEPDVFKILFSKNLNVTDPSITRVSSNIIATTIWAEIKISHPMGTKLQFSELTKNFTQDIFLKIYKAFNQKTIFDNKTDTVKYNIIENMIFKLYIDTARMREVGTPMLISIGTPLIEFFFTWYIQTKKDMPQIEEIYLIKNNQVYADFMNIF